MQDDELSVSSFAVEGKTVSGYVDENGNIVLNIDSSKALNGVVGHEITHILEGTELYDELQIVLFDYAKSRKATDSKFDNEYKERLYNTRNLYKNVDSYQGVEGFKKIKREVVADLVGDYIFTDAEFVRNLSTQHRNVFQKLYDEIKYLCKVATAGSKEARELEKVKKAFEDAYRAEGKAETGTKHSLSYTTDNRAVAVIENDIFEGKFNELSESERIKIAKNAIKEFRPGIPVSGRLIGITRKSAGHFTNSDYTDKIRNNEQRLYEDKLNIVQNIDDVIYASTNYINEPLKYPRNDNINQFARGTVLLDIGGNKYEADVLVGYTTMQDMILYDVQDLAPTNFILKEKKAQSKLAGNESYTRKTIVPSNNIISQNSGKSSENTKNSLSAENEAPIKRGDYNIYGKDIALETQEDIAPIQATETTQEETVAPIQATETAENMFPDSIAPTEELDSLLQRRNELESSLMELSESNNFGVEEFDRLNNDYKAIR